MILKFTRNLVACSMNHYPGVSHRTFGFRTLWNQRHEFDTAVNAAIEPNRTNKNYRNWRKANAFWTSSIGLGHRTKWNSLQKKTRMEQNRLIDPALKQPRRFEVLVPFITVFPYSERSYDNMLSALNLKYYFPIIPCHFPISRHENFPDYFLSSFLYFFFLIFFKEKKWLFSAIFCWISCHPSFKNLFILSVRISRYGCTREVWRARKMRKSSSRRSREQL